MSGTTAILQSSYIPWKGVFDMMNKVDTFVFFEDVQFTKRDWRTRNRIKTKDGDVWLSVPVQKASRETLIKDIRIAYHEDWRSKHKESISRSYSKSKYFDQYSYLLDKIYKGPQWERISEFNIYVIKLLADALGISHVNFVNSALLNTQGSKDDKLIEICKLVKTTRYLSGPAAKDYIEIDKFKHAGIELSYMKYVYPEYQQNFGVYNPHVTILDLIFNCGEHALEYMSSKNVERA